MQGQGEIAVLRKSGIGIAADLLDGGLSPCGAGSGNDADRPHSVLGGAFYAYLGEVFQGLPAGQQVALAVANSDHTGHCAQPTGRVCGNVTNQAADRFGGHHSVRIQRHDDVAPCFAKPRVQRACG